MRQRYGLVIASEEGSLTRNQLYDSNKPKLTMDPKPNPPHFDLIDNLPAGTRWTLANEDVSKEEVLFQVKHNLPFTPMFISYFYPVVVPEDRQSGVARQYSINQALMLFNAVGLGEERLYADADDTYFYIKHKAQRWGWSGGVANYTFYGNQFEYRVRYMIFNQPTFILEGGIIPQ